MAQLLVWINAFIPGDVAGYTVKVPKGPYAGQTAVPIPWQGKLLNSDAWPVVGFNPGYLTDQRDFSAEHKASVRMRSWAKMDVADDSVWYMESNHVTSGTVEVDLTTGKVMCSQKAVLTGCLWTSHQKDVRKVELRLVGRGSDPCVNVAANIDYNGTFVIRHHAGRVGVSFNGLLDEFPAFEAYTSYKGKTQQLFRSPPPEGNTVANLLGRAWRPINGDVSFDR